MTFRQMKKQEAENRMAAIRRARRSPAAAAAEQRRASLVGNGAKWRITNLNEVARAMAKHWGCPVTLLVESALGLPGFARASQTVQTNRRQVT